MDFVAFRGLDLVDGRRSSSRVSGVSCSSGVPSELPVVVDTEPQEAGVVRGEMLQARPQLSSPCYQTMKPTDATCRHLYSSPKQLDIRSCAGWKTSGLGISERARLPSRDLAIEEQLEQATLYRFT